MNIEYEKQVHSQMKSMREKFLIDGTISARDCEVLALLHFYRDGQTGDREMLDQQRGIEIGLKLMKKIIEGQEINKDD